MKERMEPRRTPWPGRCFLHAGRGRHIRQTANIVMVERRYFDKNA